MTQELKVVFVDPNEDTRDNLKTLLLGMDSLWMEADCSRYEFFTEIVKSSVPDIAIVDLDSDHDKAIRTLETIRKTVPSCSILAISRSTDHKAILQAIRAGAAEYLNSPLDKQELADAIERMVSSTQVDADGHQQSQLIAVAGASGGVGSTSIAVNLAAQLATDPANQVVLIDFDFALGDADVYLDLIPEYTLLDVLHNSDRLDESLLDKSLSRHELGLFLLPRPVQLQDLDDIREDDVEVMLNLVKQNYSHVVVDISKSYNKFDQLALDVATDVLMITQLDLPCLRNVVRLMMSFERDNVKDKTHVVMNRTGLNSGQVSMNKAEQFIGSEVFCQIPNDYKVMIEVRNNGIPLIKAAPKAGITTAIRALTEKLTNGVAAVEEEKSSAPAKRSLFGFGSKR